MVHCPLNGTVDIVWKGSDPNSRAKGDGVRTEKHDVWRLRSYEACEVQSSRGWNALHS